MIALGLALVLRLTMSLLALLFGWIPVMQVRLWSPMEFVIIGSFIVIGGAMEELVWWKRNIYIGMNAHCLLNLIGTTVLFAQLLG